MAEQIIAEYKLKVDEAVKNLNKVQSETKELDADLKKTGKDGQRSMDEIGKSAGGLSSVMKKLGGVIAAAFAVDRIIAFGKEAVRLAAQAEGIERAFRKLNNPNLLADLRRATRGTVTDLELMRSAVRANNFQIPLEKLATFFEFATKRSIETGESVDYLVNSIVDGIGRKSTLVLDNLGISAAQLQEEIKKTGDFGVAAANIIEQSLEQTGEVADTTKIRISQLRTAFENAQKTAGDYIITFGYESAKMFGIISQNQLAVDELAKSLENMSAARIGEQIDVQAQAVKDAETAYINYRKVMDQVAARSPELAAKEEKRLAGEVKLQKELYELIIQTFNARLDAVRDGFGEDEFIDPSQLDAITKSVKEQKEETETYVRSIAKLNAELKKYQEDLKNAEIGSSEFFSIIDKVEKKTRELADAIAMTKLADALKIDEEEEYQTPDLSNVKAAVDEEVAIRKDGSERIQQINDQMLKDALQAWKEFNDKREEDTKLTDEQIGQLVSQVFYTIASLSDTISQIVQNNYQEELNALERKFEDEEITREQYDEKRRQLQRKAAQDEKNARIFSAILNTAAAVTAALNTQPFLPLGPIAAAIAAATGAAQIAAIASQPLPQFAKGVIDLKGEGTETSDSIHAKLSRGESVMTAKETRKYKDELMAIRNGTFENLILSKYVKPMVDESLFNGFKDMGRSAELNGITANLKDHNILAGLDRLRQSQSQGFRFLAQELKVKNQKRGGYRA